MQPIFVSEFVWEVKRTLKLEVVAIESASPNPNIRRTLQACDIQIELQGSAFLSQNCDIAWSDHHYALSIDLGRHLGNISSPITSAKPLTTFTVENPGGRHSVDPSVASEIAILYIKFLRSSQQAISEVANQQYLSNSSDVLGLRGLIQATHHLVGIDHIAVMRSALSGAVQVLAQHGNVRSLQEREANARDRIAARTALAIALAERGYRHLSQKTNDPLFSQGSSPDREVIYVGAERYASDALKRDALKGVWYRASTAVGPLSWEQLALFNGLAQAMSVITSVGSILTARLVQLQKITHSNSSNLSAMQSTLAEAISGTASIYLASRKTQIEPYAPQAVGLDANASVRQAPPELQLANIASLSLQVREHLSYLKLNIQQMQAKVTLSLWLEHEAGLPQNLGLEQFNVLDVIGEVMSCAPALVESWTSDYSGTSRPTVDTANRRDDVFLVKSRRDILSFVMLNLLENAVKYRSSSRPRLKYDVFYGRDRSSYQTEVQIQFTDDGLGIDPADTKSVFDLGWRSQRHYREIPGQGLGLYQCHALLQLVGGNISLTSSRNPTSFTITIPVQERIGGGV